MSQVGEVRAIADGKFFWFVEWDIRIPRLCVKGLTVIFKNIELDHEALSQNMRKITESKGYLQQQMH